MANQNPRLAEQGLFGKVKFEFIAEINLLILTGVERTNLPTLSSKTVKELNQVEEGALLIGRFDLLVRSGCMNVLTCAESVSEIRAMPGQGNERAHSLEGFTKDYTVDENDALAISLLRAQGPLQLHFDRPEEPRPCRGGVHDSG